MQGQKSVSRRAGKAPWRSLALGFLMLPFLTVSELVADLAGLVTGTNVTSVVETEDPYAESGGAGEQEDNGDPGTPHP